VNQNNKTRITSTLLLRGLSFLSLLLLPFVAQAAANPSIPVDLTQSWFGIVSVVIFVIAYGMVVNEEFLDLRKSKPVMVAAGIIWILVGTAYYLQGDVHTAANALRHDLQEFAELMLFLLAAMTYIKGPCSGSPVCWPSSSHRWPTI